MSVTQKGMDAASIKDIDVYGEDAVVECSDDRTAG